MKKSRLHLLSRMIGGVVLLAMLAGLSACGGGGGSSSTSTVTNADPTGYYEFTGTLTLTGSQAAQYTNEGAIVYNNHLFMFDQGLSSRFSYLLYDINISSINGNSFTGSGKTFVATATPQDGALSPSNMTGTINAGSSITGTLSGNIIATGTFSLTYNNQMGSLPSASTNWGDYVQSSTTQYVLSTDGKGGISTNTTTTDGNVAGCTIASGGTIKEIGTSRLYNVVFTFANCATTSYDGDYTGMAVVQDAAASALDLAMVKTDGAHSFFGKFSAQP